MWLCWKVRFLWFLKNYFGFTFLKDQKVKNTGTGVFSQPSLIIFS